MRVLLVSHAFHAGDGAARYSMEIRDELVARGHEVRCIAFGNPLAYLPLRGLLSFGIDYVILSFTVFRWNPEVIHILVEPYSALLAYIQKSKGEKRVLTLHGSYATYPEHASGFMRSLLWNLFKKTLRTTDAVIAVSEATRVAFETEAQKHGVVFPQVTVIHNGVTLPPKELVKKATVKDQDNLVVLSVGGIKPRKGIQEILEGCAEYIRTHGSSLQYRIVGSTQTDESYMRRLGEVIQQQGLQDTVHFLGHLSGNALQQEYQKASVLALLPRDSSKDREGFGLVYLEANAYGVPSLGARGTVSEEAIREGVSGFLVDADNPVEIADALNKIRKGSLPKDGPRSWAEEHVWPQVVEKLEKVYAG